MPAVLLRHDEPAVAADIMSPSASQARGRPSTISELTERHPPLCPTDGDAIVPVQQAKEKQRPHEMRDGGARKVDKKSGEYLLKSLLAGGIAGCAVWCLISSLPS
jgi:solute carrier family 25 protein 16|tara:strand:+ start:41507 stop:41821 length:315 start_codon:yes stop_codon:yes gene_type:complete